MSVLIKNMEMPTGCCAVKLKVWPDEQVEIFGADGEWETSMAIPVPPHGRLGDLDRLEQMFADMPFYSAEDAAQIIRLAPTIIEAEE